MSLSSLTPEQQQALLNGPALTPAPGITPQLDNPPNSYGAAVAIITLCIILSTLALAMRMYTKLCLIRQFSSADYAIVLGWTVFIGYSVPAFLLSSVASSVHQWNLRLKDLVPFLKYAHVGSVMYGFCICFVKLSILLQILQLFPPPTKKHYMWWSCRLLIVLNFLYYAIATGLEIWSCDPVAKSWNIFITQGSCLNVFAINISASSINTASDIIILILPQVSIWNLQMSRQKRLGASAVFLVGIFACVSAAVRLAYTVKLSMSSDLVYWTWYAGIWTYPEMTSGIIVACAPVSLKFFQSVLASSWASQVNQSLRSLMGRRRSLGTTGRTSQEIAGLERSDQADSNPLRPKGMWSRAYADLEDTQRDRSSVHSPVEGNGVYVMHRIHQHESSADGNSSIVKVLGPDEDSPV